MTHVVLFVFPLLMAFAAFSDLLTMRISNTLVVMIAVSFFAVAALAHLPLDAVFLNMGCASVVLLITFAMFAPGWIGGGDAKLAAATTLWMGFGLTLPYLVYTALLGGVLTLLILGLRRLPLTPLMARYRWIERLHDPRTGVPYGIALAVAALLMYSQTAVFKALIG